jgi:DNA-binding transcriptional MerR regulator
VVERLLALPSSTLRHWEREVSVVSPRKDAFGRRVYSDADLCILLRLKHLALDRGLGLSAARERLIQELSGPMPDERARIAEVRSELVSLLAKAEEAGRKLG